MGRAIFSSTLARLDPDLFETVYGAVAPGSIRGVGVPWAGRAAPRANRLLAELKVFFGWAANVRGMGVGLKSVSSRRLGDLRFRPLTADNGS